MVYDDEEEAGSSDMRQGAEEQLPFWKAGVDYLDKVEPDNALGCFN